MILVGPVFFVILGIVIIVLDLHTALFLTPIGLAFVTWGILTAFALPYWICGLISAVVLVLGYVWYVKFAQSVKQGEVFGPMALVGKTGVVKKVGDDSAIIEVEFEEWVAVPEEGDVSILKPGMKVQVVGVRGIKLLVKPLE